MNHPYTNLISPIRTQNTLLKNRLISANAMPHFAQGPEGYPAESTMAYLANLARNGAGIVVFAEWENPMLTKIGNPELARFMNFDTTIEANKNYFCQMAEDIHYYGAKLLLNTTISLPAGYSLDGSAGEGMGDPNMAGQAIQLLPKAEIPGVVERFVNHVRKYKMMGYDGVDLRADPYLLPDLMPRHDEYGGESVENRCRLLMEACVALKKAFGPNFLISLTIAGEQPFGYIGGQKGYYLEDAIAFSKLFDGVADILQVREKDKCKSHPTGFTHVEGEYNSLIYTRAMKEAGVQKTLLAAAGGFQMPEQMEQALKRGDCDLFAVARGFIADSHYGEKIYEGHGEDIVPCILCNKCHGTLQPKDPFVNFCSVNPEMGIHHKLWRLNAPSGKRRKVAIIGGGPAGMRAALLASENGHQVTLYEKTDTLGGQLCHSDYASFKWPLRRYKNWLITQILRSDVKVYTNKAPSRKEIEDCGYDAVITALGAKPNVPQIPGLRDENGNVRYPSCIQVFGHESELGHRVVIIGGSETGIETAMYLAECGHDVTILTRQREIAADAPKLHGITWAFVREPEPGETMEHDKFGTGFMTPAWKKYANLNTVVSVTTERVEQNTVYATAKNGEALEFEADSIVICGGMKSRLEEAMDYAGTAPIFFNIGDSDQVGNLQKLNRQAYARISML
jgi:2,4-dienoyl-CoA reductase-like NADH-dependent reductase (Old Yellow Enzyme family)